MLQVPKSAPTRPVESARRTPSSRPRKSAPVSQSIQTPTRPKRHELLQPPDWKLRSQKSIRAFRQSFCHDAISRTAALHATELRSNHRREKGKTSQESSRRGETKTPRCCARRRRAANPDNRRPHRRTDVSPWSDCRGSHRESGLEREATDHSTRKNVRSEFAVELPEPLPHLDEQRRRSPAAPAQSISTPRPPCSRWQQALDPISGPAARKQDTRPPREQPPRQAEQETARRQEKPDTPTLPGCRRTTRCPDASA